VLVAHIDYELVAGSYLGLQQASPAPHSQTIACCALRNAPKKLSDSMCNST
jgi:hypothetical protein